MGNYNFKTRLMSVSFHNEATHQGFKKHLKKVLHPHRKHSKIVRVVDNVRFHHPKLLKLGRKNTPN